ncbi:palmitoyltransferase ZDHHC23-B [Schistocerca gregaria]|uniref:palmitoyltransferase ZDHHC23-B n=1 Tax=Schistocerca gregaria TaxID=7010 RepID=UPI00211DFC27|nr:palmitoyltransferase ZDHHC23-B [Schistocerca gregaria]
MDGRDSLCCCEYINRNQERYHMLECCCNCEELDICVDRLFRCRKVPVSLFHAVMVTICDRMRIPWLRGARPLAPEMFLPPLLLALIGLMAAQGPWWTVLTLGSVPLAARLMLHCVPPRYFVAWMVSSVVLPVLVFEASVVPMLEILPDENLILVVLTLATFILLHFVWRRSRSSLAIPLAPIDGTGVACAACRRRVPLGARHCKYCRVCSVGRIHHCIWLDCCIGEYNRHAFITALVLGTGALIYGSILILTSVCRPFFWLDFILLPYDCSDVYHDLEIALCFVCALYALIMAAFLLPILLRHGWMLTRDSWSQKRLTSPHDYQLPVA